MKFFFDDFGSDFNQIRNWIVYSGRSILWVLDLVMEFSIEEFLESLYLKENSFFFIYDNKIRKNAGYNEKARGWCN